MMRVVFDTNVPISAALSRTGPPFQCLDLAKQGVIDSVICKEIVEEFKQKMIQKFKRSTAQADDLIGDVLGYSQVVSIRGELRAVEADPSDDKVVECTVVGREPVSRAVLRCGSELYPERPLEAMRPRAGLLPCRHSASTSRLPMRIPALSPPRFAAYPERTEENMDIIKPGRSESYAHARTYR